jgi:riboflavin kinase/FMN adenylyltransferase
MHVVTIGNFDGVHEGHRALIEKARELAKEGAGPAQVTVVTFEPSPEAILAPGGAPDRLMNSGTRSASLLEFGVDEVVELPTTRALLGTDPEDFIEEILERLSGKYPVGAFVEGADFRFGCARKGTVDSLGEHGRRAGFEVVVVPNVSLRLNDGLVVEARSSTIRQLLGLGRVEDAAIMLGQPFTASGIVVIGDQRGRELGYPTANLDQGDQILPGDGVYAAKAFLPDGQLMPAAVSIGSKPTFEVTHRVLEAHILDWDGEIDDYGWVMNVELIRRLRGQDRYDGVEPLLRQMERDCERTREIVHSYTENAVEADQ